MQEPISGKNQTSEVESVEKVFLVFINEDETDDKYVEDELESLVQTAGGEVVGYDRQRRKGHPEVATFLGKGKVEEITPMIQDCGADLAIIDGELSAIQQRNLGTAWKVRVIDRTQLILDIFSQRAHTREGKLQVSLARLTYMMPRLMSVYTKFEQQQGGIGIRGGAGETKLEADRRVTRERIALLKDELEEVKKQRLAQRVERRKLPYPVGSLVGYTSAGKSTLLNILTGSDVYADPKLFATLDPTIRKFDFPDGFGVMLADTVGFIRKLPHSLVAAFRATLEEVTEADFLLHVIDVSHPEYELQRDAVLEVLDELGVKKKPIINVYNKCDLVVDQYELRRMVASEERAVYISAKTGEGLPELVATMERLTRELLNHVELLLPYGESGLLALAYDRGRVYSADYEEAGIAVVADVTADLAGRMRQVAIQAGEQA